MAISVPTWMGNEIEVMFTTEPGRTHAVASSHGIGRPKVMSNTLEPIEEERAMSPWPSRATNTEDSASGIEVPAANTVTPMTDSGMPIVVPISSANHTMT
eukprot:CAMPEP_0119338960 /NCGR_PEP_ID=MMETSP1333-20130426/97278_1 /TAXON_ID=418940 /ORGANISM="Scyphosphaera apsteinii, Strain RCC1455" /LENGTH=99 /DNA_ID=CAMNT_0007350383 /DNA_START=189 /DNA_END=488 /DNA_ORIENTATION=+